MALLLAVAALVVEALGGRRPARRGCTLGHMFEYEVELPDGTVHRIESDQRIVPPSLITVGGVRYFRATTLTVVEAQRRPFRYLRW